MEVVTEDIQEKPRYDDWVRRLRAQMQAEKKREEWARRRMNDN